VLFQRKENRDDDEEEDAEDKDLADDYNPKKHVPVLKDLEELQKIFQERPYNLDWLVSKVEKVLKQCNANACPHDEPSAKRQNLPNQTTPESRRRKPKNAGKLSSLKRGRAALRDQHGDDPLEESREIAEQATGVAARRSAQKHSTQKKTAFVATDDIPEIDDVEEDGDEPTKKAKNKPFYEEKKTKSQIEFGDSDEEDDGDGEGDGSPQKKRAKLSKVPARAKAVVQPQPRKKKGGVNYYVGPPPDEGIFDEFGNVLQRIKFSDEEEGCILAALHKDHSLEGKWAEIKTMYGQILRNRTTVMIKDKFRNMKRKGLVDFLYEKTSDADNDSNENVEDIQEDGDNNDMEEE